MAEAVSAKSDLRWIWQRANANFSEFWGSSNILRMNKSECRCFFQMNSFSGIEMTSDNRDIQTWSAIRTLLHGKINPKNWPVLSLGDVGFRIFLRVVSGDCGKPCQTFLIGSRPLNGVSLPRQKIVFSRGDLICSCAAKGDCASLFGGPRNQVSSKELALEISRYEW